MTQDPEDLLWQLPQGPAESSGAPIDDDELEAFERGELPAAERRRLEARLASDPEARRRWLDRHRGLRRPSRDLRRRVLQARPAPEPKRQARRRGRASIWAAAASLLLAFGLAWLVGYGRGGGASAPGPVPEHMVTVRGLAEERAGSIDEPTPDAAEETMVFADTRVVVEAEPVTSSNPEGSETWVYAVYRRDGDRLRRIRGTKTDLRWTYGPGAVRLEATASELLGTDRPGTYRLLFLVAEDGGLPRSLPLDTPSVGAGRRWLAYNVQLRLLEIPADP
ncbi:MAG: hypothetical protein AAGD06_09815 [Acidobacteriota bacterium]